MPYFFTSSKSFHLNTQFSFQFMKHTPIFLNFNETMKINTHLCGNLTESPNEPFAGW